MATSQNGYPAGTKRFVGTTDVTVPGTKTVLPVKAGDVATVLLWVATRWHREVEPLVEPGSWGYADRNIRGSATQVSNHASGTAIDLNAPKHPLGTPPAKTMSKAQIAAAQRIEADSGGVVRWGGSYTGRQDPMHWEINASPAQVAKFAARITGGTAAAVTPTATPAPAPNPPQEDDDMTRIIRFNDGSGECYVVDYGAHTMWHIPDVTQFDHLSSPPEKGGAGIPVTPQDLAPELYGSYRRLT